jgi:uroporphyrin-III C-methyltransferase
MVGFVSLVGAGPGSADYLTRKAERCLREADIILHDRLVGEDILALIPRGTPRIFAGKSCKIHYMSQMETNAALVELAKQGKHVVRLKGGDPFIFGRGGEEAQALAKANIPFEIVPGITAAAACGAMSGIPLTHRDHCHGIHTITGHLSAEQANQMDWSALANPQMTLVVYMGLTNAKLITRKLVEYGRSAETPAAAIQNGTLPNQRILTTTLATLTNELKNQNFASPTLLIIGEVVSVADEIGAMLRSTITAPGADHHDHEERTAQYGQHPA